MMAAKAQEKSRGDAAKARGRPRDPGREAAILDAARALLAERGFEALSIEGVAARAGVGKQTIYRRWPGKADLLFAAFKADAEVRVVLAEGGSLRADLEIFLTRTLAALRGSAPGLRALMAQAQLDPAFRRAFDDAFVAHRRHALAGLILRHLGNGEAARAETAVVVDMIYGAIWYRLLLGHGRLGPAFARDLAAAAARAVAV
jgi:AcrR family transcriptional regulator